MFIGLFSFEFVAPSPSIYFALCIVYVWFSCVFIVILTSWFWLSFRVLADNSLAFRLGTVCYLITWLMTPVCSLTPISVCHIKSLIFFTLCIWVPHSLSQAVVFFASKSLQRQDCLRMKLSCFAPGYLITELVITRSASHTIWVLIEWYPFLLTKLFSLSLGPFILIWVPSA